MREESRRAAVLGDGAAGSLRGGVEMVGCGALGRNVPRSTVHWRVFVAARIVWFRRNRHRLSIHDRAGHSTT